MADSLSRREHWRHVESIRAKSGQVRARLTSKKRESISDEKEAFLGLGVITEGITISNATSKAGGKGEGARDIWRPNELEFGMIHGRMWRNLRDKDITAHEMRRGLLRTSEKPY